MQFNFYNLFNHFIMQHKKPQETPHGKTKVAPIDETTSPVPPEAQHKQAGTSEHPSSEPPAPEPPEAEPDPAPGPETPAPPAPPASAATGTDMEAAIAEAEQRGYMRGRNERIEELMHRPGIMERPGSQEIHQATTRNDRGFLSHIKVSIWDR